MRALFIPALALATLTASARVGRPLIQTYVGAKIGTSDIAWCAVQDEAGVLYVGCSPVISYDGHRWRRHEVPGTYGVRALAWRGGRLWVGGVNEVGYFEQAVDGLGPYHSLRSRLPTDAADPGDVWQVFPRGNGAVFVTHDRILWWTGSAFQTWQLANERRLCPMEAGGQIYVFEAGTGWWSWEPAGMHLLLTTAELEGNGILGVQERPGGVLRLVTNRGLLDYSGGRLTPVGSDVAGLLQSGTLSAVAPLRSGGLALGTLRLGVFLFGADGTLQSRIGPNEGLPSGTVYGLAEERTGALWVMSPTYVARIAAPGAPRLCDGSTGLVGRNFTSISSQSGEIAVVGAEGLFLLARDAADFDRVQGAPPLINAVLGLPDGWLLAGFHGVVAWDGDTFRPVFEARSDAFLLEPAATPGAFLSNKDVSLVRVASADSGTPPRWITDLTDIPISAAEVGGRLWVSTTSRGVFRVRADAERARPEPCNPPGATGRSLVAAFQGRLVAFTSAGAFRWDDAAGAFTRLSDFPSGTVQAIGNERRLGQRWVALRTPSVGGEEGLLVAGQLSVDQTGKESWTPVPIEGLEGLSDVQALHEDANENVWIGGAGGVLRLASATLPSAISPPSPRLSASIGAGVKLSADHSPITFDFTTVEFARADVLRYQTALGAATDPEWSAPTSAHTVTFNTLRSGTYAFQVRAVTPEGLASPPARWYFTVLAPWYLRPFTLGLFALGLAGSVYGWIRWRVHRLQLHTERLAQLVREKTAQLEKANAAKTEFVANMTHEIRNPISGILGLTMALQDTGLSSRQEEITRSVHSCAELLATLVEDVLDFAQIESGKFTLKPRVFALRPLLEQTLAMLEQSARQSLTPLRLEYVDPLPAWVEADASRLQQILLNYLTNALKFAPGREIILGAVAAADGSPEVRFYVRDRGPGIPPDELPALFDKFSRLKAAQEHQIRGTGLGLAVCRLLAEKMGGRVGVDSIPGEGACFWVVLPMAPAEPPASTAPLSLSARRVLVVEDLPYNAASVQAMLRRLGFTADVADTGPAALDALLRTPYDVAFLDLNLPGFTGDEVARRYRTARPDARTLLIATTASTSPADQAACRDAGMDAFIAKPLRPEKLARALNDLLNCSLPLIATPSPTGDPPDLDLSFLRDLTDPTTGGLASQIDRYLVTLEQICDAAQAALAADAVQRQRAGHLLMSHARLLRADLLTDLGRRFEAEATGPVEELATLLESYRREAARLRGTLETFRDAQART